MVTKQEELTYYALKHHSLKEAERAELKAKMDEFEKRNQVYHAQPWESALNRGLNINAHRADQQRYAIRQPENRTGQHNKEVDLTGRKYGKLTVIRRSQDRTLSGYWIVECDCGQQEPAEKKRLLDGRKTRCKKCEVIHKQRERDRKTSDENNLHGKKFYKLTVLGVSAVKINNKKAWDCVCDCGNRLSVNTFKITSGERKSCSTCARARHGKA